MEFERALFVEQHVHEAPLISTIHICAPKLHSRVEQQPMMEQETVKLVKTEMISDIFTYNKIS